MKIFRRREFISLGVGAALVSALPLPALVPISTKVDFPRDVKFRLYMIHNRYTDSQLARLLVWRDGDGHYDFTASDERDRSLAADHKWECLGRLRWVVGRDGYYEHHVVPI